MQTPEEFVDSLSEDVVRFQPKGVLVLFQMIEDRDRGVRREATVDVLASLNELFPKELDERLAGSYKLGNISGYNNGLAEGLNEGDKRTCKIVWETIEAYETQIRGLGGGAPGHDDEMMVSLGLACLAGMRDKLSEILPYGPNEETRNDN